MWGNRELGFRLGVMVERVEDLEEKVVGLDERREKESR